MKSYTVKQLAELTGVTVKTLHYYDEINLLKPAERSDSDYRLYGQEELLRLQQIMLYKELEFPLAEIKNILDDPEFDGEKALRQHKRLLLQKKSHYKELISTIDKTLERILEDNQLVTDKELYGGFTPEQRERYDREAKEKYGDMYTKSQARVRKMTKGEWKALGEESEAVSKGMAQLMHKEPTDPEVQALIKRHHDWVSHFYDCPMEMYKGLADLYTQNPEFRAHYDRYATGLADFMKAAMFAFCRLQGTSPSSKKA